MRIKISESEVKSILKQHKLIKESADEFDLASNHNPNNATFVDRVNCDPFCQFDTQEVSVIKKCFSAESFRRNVEFQPTPADKDEVTSMTLGICATKGQITKSNADYLTKKFHNVFYNTWKNYSEGASAKTVEQQKNNDLCDKIKNSLDKKNPEIDELKKLEGTKCFDEIIDKLKIKYEPFKTYCESAIPEVESFYIDYFDYKSKPQILDKIFSIDVKNSKLGIAAKDVVTSKDDKIEKYKKVIDGLKSDFFSKLKIELDYDYNFDKSSTVMGFVFPLRTYVGDYTIYMCPLSKLLVNENYVIDKNQVLSTLIHEGGHLIDAHFQKNGINLYVSDSGADTTTSTGRSVYPHTKKGLSGELLPLSGSDDYSDKQKKYMESEVEIFARYQQLRLYLKQQGYDFTKESKTYFCQFIFKLFKDGEIFESRLGDNESVKDLTLDGDYMTFYFPFDMFWFESKNSISALNWIFDRFGYVVKAELPAPDEYFFTYNLGEIYDEMQEDYVEVKRNNEIDDRT